MTFPRLLIMITVVLFGTISIVAAFKGTSTPTSQPIEVELQKEVQVVKTEPKKKTALVQIAKEKTTPAPAPSVATATPAVTTAALPDADRIQELFNVDGPKLPIVETVIYTSHASWQKGRPAWLSDYARHYETSRHFIARSLNRKADYLKQDVAEGMRFNVLRQDKDIQFYLLVDLSRCKMWLYYDEPEAKERVLLKTYAVGLGRPDKTKPSGYLSPLGRYTLGNKTAVYKPKVMGHFKGDPVEMITIFGTRWIPFDKELGGCTEPSKGLGLHGVPWNPVAGKLSEDKSSLGKHESDGCIRMASADVEEIFAIVTSRPTVIELVKDFHDARYGKR